MFTLDYKGWRPDGRFKIVQKVATWFVNAPSHAIGKRNGMESDEVVDEISWQGFE